AIPHLDSAAHRGYFDRCGLWTERRAMSDARPPRTFLIFTGTGPILVLSTFPELTDERLVSKLRYKGIIKFIAYEVDTEAVKKRYAAAYENIAEDLQDVEDLRVLDFNGHQIMANFSLDELGEPVKYSG
ncbi:MAG: hypothetical protein WBG05_06500, partial [Thermoanaerobaculia bacterium]